MLEDSEIAGAGRRAVQRARRRCPRRCGGELQARCRGHVARQHDPADARRQRHQDPGSAHLGGTPVVRKAITSGEIDIYPEYTGNAAFFFNKADDPVWKNLEQGYELAKKLDYDANKIVWLAPAPANNTWAIAVRKDVAESAKLVTMSDFGRWVAGGGKVVLAASAEFVNSESALPSFQKAYGFTLKPEQLIVLSGGDTAATIKAAADQTNGANAAMVYGTDGAVAASGLVVLEDDMNVQPVYAPAPIVREAVLKANPKIAEILAPVFASLSRETLQDLNAQIQVGGEPARAVAEAYLQQQGLVSHELGGQR